MTDDALDPAEFLAAHQPDPVDAATVAALIAGMRRLVPSGAPVEVAAALGKVLFLDLCVDPLARRGIGLDAGLIAGLAPRLTDLRVSRSPLRDAQALSELVSLRVLACSECGLTDLTFLAGLRLLEDLDVSRNDISSLAPLRGLDSLKRLVASGNLVDDLTPLSKLRALRILDVSDNRLADLGPLQDSTSLVELHFRNNGIRTLRPLRDLRELARVGCGGNPLNDDDYDVIPRSVRVE